MSQEESQEDDLKNSLKTILLQHDLSLHQDLIKRIANELKISVLDCAAAIAVLNHPDLLPNKQKKEKPLANNKAIDLPQSIAKQKIVRYRLDIGRKHQVTLEQIKTVLVDESGVERKKIGWIDIRNYYTLIELPDGMPADIFQLLTEVEINSQKLNLKRVKLQRRFYRRNSKKKYSQQSNKE